MPLNLIDIVLVMLVLLSVLNGWRRGFILGSLDLVGWALVLVVGLRFYQPVARWLGAYVDLWGEVWDRPIAFVALAILTGGVVQFAGYALLRRVPKDVHEKAFNRLLGLVPGLANGLITAALVAALLLAIPFNEALRERARESPLANQLAIYAERFESLCIRSSQKRSPKRSICSPFNLNHTNVCRCLTPSRFLVRVLIWRQGCWSW
jgi:uncharacterized membrane protein required for colicin V production